MFKLRTYLPHFGRPAANSEDSNEDTTSPSTTAGSARTGSSSPLSPTRSDVRSQTPPTRSLLARAGSGTIRANGSASISAIPSSANLNRTSTVAIEGLPVSVDEPYRILLVRHAQSGNKGRRAGEAASPDPGLSPLGHEQADALGRRLSGDFRASLMRHGNASSAALVVSSPMRRCLLTIRPAIQMLSLDRQSVFCHGACFEYGCAGAAWAGSSVVDVGTEFPEFSPIGFSEAGTWDYRGSSSKENEAECRQRVKRIAEWLHVQAPRLLQKHAADKGLPCLILVAHQTLLDAMCRLLIEGSVDEWEYADIKYKIQNASITELFLHPGGRATLGMQNDGMHLAQNKRRFHAISMPF